MVYNWSLKSLQVFFFFLVFVCGGIAIMHCYYMRAQLRTETAVWWTQEQWRDVSVRVVPLLPLGSSLFHKFLRQSKVLKAYLWSATQMLPVTVFIFFSNIMM